VLFACEKTGTGLKFDFIFPFGGRVPVIFISLVDPITTSFIWLGRVTAFSHAIRIFHNLVVILVILSDLYQV
jgi:hypothetical protein